MVHHLIRALEAGGERAAAELVERLGARAESVCELCYRLYTVCERKKRAAEALSYNLSSETCLDCCEVTLRNLVFHPIKLFCYSYGSLWGSSAL